MTYENLIQTISIIIENESIYKNGLTLIYCLSENNHKQMNEHLFYKSNPVTTKFIPSDEFEVNLDNIVVKFVKPKIEIDEEEL